MPLQYFTFGIKNDFFPSYILMVHVLDQEVGPKGPQEHELKYNVASVCYKQHTWKK